MSSTPTRSEDTGRPGERERVNEQDLPENKDAVSMELLKKENGNLKHTADIQAGKILRLEMELHETKQARIDDSACAGKSKLEIALYQAKAEVESMRLSQETRQQNILELVEKHNYRITIPVASHAKSSSISKRLSLRGTRNTSTTCWSSSFSQRLGNGAVCRRLAKKEP